MSGEEWDPNKDPWDPERAAEYWRRLQSAEGGRDSVDVPPAPKATGPVSTRKPLATFRAGGKTLVWRPVWLFLSASWFVGGIYLKYGDPSAGFYGDADEFGGYIAVLSAIAFVLALVVGGAGPKRKPPSKRTAYALGYLVLLPAVLAFAFAGGKNVPGMFQDACSFSNPCRADLHDAVFGIAAWASVALLGLGAVIRRTDFQSWREDR